MRYVVSLLGAKAFVSVKAGREQTLIKMAQTKKVPSKVKAIAKKFEILGKVTIEPSFDKDHWTLLLHPIKYIDISILFIIALQNGIKKFYPRNGREIAFHTHI